MRFAYPELRLLLLAIPVLLLLYGWAHRRRVRALGRMGEGGLVERMAARSPRGWVVLRRSCLLATVLLLTLSAARPQSALDWINVEQSGIDLVVALDVSQSMTARDIKPSRLERAKQDVRDLLSGLEGDRVALVVFSGEAVVQSPLTVDYSAIRLLLDVIEPGMLARPGTDLEAALERAADCFDENEEGGTRAVLLITDGESHEGDLDRAIGRLRDERVRVYALGIGRVEGEPIPVEDEQGETTYKSDREGRVVMTRLDEATLQRVALDTDGAYVPITTGTQGVDHVTGLLDRLEEKAFEAGKYQLYEDRFVYFLAPALALLVMECFLSDRRRRGIA